MSDESRFRTLLSPGHIGGMYVKNRIVMSPMGTNLAGEDGYITEQIKRYYEERAKGGAGLIIVEVASIDYPKGAVMPRQVAISDDEFIPALAELVEVVHRHGAKIAIQLQHGGKLATTDMKQGRVPVSASAVPIPMDAALKDLSLAEIMKIASGFTEIPEGGPQARELAVEEIGEIVQRFGEAAERAKKAGFDGVEIHAAHSYIIAQFLSRAQNKRQDAYGGELKNRARILLEIIHAVRERVGPHYPVWCRLDGREFRIEDGITAEDAQKTARMASEAGLDAIHVSAYGGASGIGATEGPFVHDPGSLLPLAEGIRRVVDVPVIAVGRISPDRGEKALRGGQADFIAMGRQLLADPELPNKLVEGRPEDIRPCICCYTCGGQIYVNESVQCAVNPAVGKEAEFQLDVPAEKSKRVVVVGGGPAGMQAAISATLRGHKVTLCDKERRLGGTMVIAALSWEANQDLVDYLRTQVEKLPIDVRLRQEVTPRLIDDLNPDTVIMATGAKRVAPPIPGVDGNNVITGNDFRQIFTGYLKEGVSKKLSWSQRLMLYFSRPLLQEFYDPSLVRKLTKRVFPVGGKRVAIIGGELVGCELAEFLAERGREVTILHKEDTLAAEMSIPRRARVLHQLREHGTTIVAGVTFDEITDKGVTVTTKEGEKQTFEVDTILLAIGLQPNLELSNAIQGKVSEIHVAGDCGELRLIQGSIADGISVGSTI